MKTTNHKGFTLIEIIVVLMLVSILAAASGFGLVEVARGYATTRENARMAQVAQIALQRISRELSLLESVSSATGASIAVTTPAGSRSMGLFGTTILLDEDTTPADGEILIDRVSALQLTYTNSTGTPWTTAQTVDALLGIDISLTLSRTDGIALLPFTTSVTPRNNGTLNAPS